MTMNPDEFDGTFSSYAMLAGDMSNYPNRGTEKGLSFAVLGLVGEAGEVAGHFGKAVWHDDLLGEGNLSPERGDLLKKELGDVLWYAAALAYELGTTLETEAYNNLKKLADRQKRGVIRGDGDNR